MAYSPEFGLALACCRWNCDPTARPPISLVTGLDWTLFLKIASRHRVEGLVWAALQKANLPVPPEPARWLSARARAIAAQNLHLAAESRNLRDRLEHGGVPVVFIKGLTLAAIAYGTIMHKRGWDIDLLVPPGQVETAASILESTGYVLHFPDKPNARQGLPAWHAAEKESVWHNLKRNCWVELHSRLVDNLELLTGVDPETALIEVEVAQGIVLPTLAMDELFAYLCVHGASSAWFRLKWIADLAALLADVDPVEIEHLYVRALALGAGRAPALALLLCQHFFQTGFTPALARQIEAERITRQLFKLCVSQMAGRSVATELDRQRLGTLNIHLVQFGLLPGVGSKFREARRQLRSWWRR